MTNRPNLLTDADGAQWYLGRRDCDIAELPKGSNLHLKIVTTIPGEAPLAVVKFEGHPQHYARNVAGKIINRIFRCSKPER